MSTQLHTHTQTQCFDVNSSGRGVQSTTPPVFPPPSSSLFSSVFHCFPSCDTFNGMSRNPALSLPHRHTHTRTHTHTHTHTHIHTQTMPCSQPRLSTFVRGEPLKHAHIHTHIHAHSCLISLVLSLSLHTHIHHLSSPPFTISCPPRLSVSCLVSCVRDCGFALARVN